MTEAHWDQTSEWTNEETPDTGGNLTVVAPVTALPLVPSDVFTDEEMSIDITEPLTTDQAKELTETIRSTSEVLFMLLARAHAGKAWLALGYSNFGDYVREEFDMSRSRAYQILDQAKVVAAIEAAAPEGAPIPNISEAAARDLKSIIGEVVPEIAERTHGLPADEAGDVVEEIVENYRDQVRNDREQDALEREEAAEDAAERRGFSETGGGIYTPPPPAPTYDDEDDYDPALIRRNVQAAYDLYSSIAACKSMPDVESVVNTIPPARRMQVTDSLDPAIQWLLEFREAWMAAPWHTEDNGDADLDGDDSYDDDDLADDDTDGGI